MTIKSIECAIVDKGFEEGWIVPQAPPVRTGKKVAVVGSGPAGLACAAQLNKVGHWVTVFERADRIGGLLMYGIPNMKLDKEAVVQRRVELLAAEGVRFITNTEVGTQYPIDKLRAKFDAIVLAAGQPSPTTCPIPAASSRASTSPWTSSAAIPGTCWIDVRAAAHNGHFISAEGKNVIVIGGGDTGTDCVATSLRHNCKIWRSSRSFPDRRTNGRPTTPGRSGRVSSNRTMGRSRPRLALAQDPRTYQISTKRFVGDSTAVSRNCTRSTSR